MKKVILDVDTGIDDALAMILAFKSEELDILGITTVSGNVCLDQAALNTKKVLTWLGLGNQVKIFRGADRPLLREPVFEHEVHGNDGLGGALKDMEADMPEDGAVDFIIEQAEKYKGELTLIPTAPLTNIALAIRKKPEITQWIKEMVIMGGSVKSLGNITPLAEFNSYVDPEAAKIVFHSDMPITLVGLDVTKKALLTDEHIAQLEGSRVGEFVKNATAHYMNNSYKRNGVKSCALHDPLAVGVALDKSLVKTEKLYVDVETKSELCDGQTVCDFGNRLGKEPNIDVCLEVDHEKFIRMFIDYLKR
ncbi:purine nucleosidase [Scopulibacillus daqui]|uniref:Purine nucleosidase n=1 Tax=Scopulibacillus daqui TaxID=1469162 RepID=A0ABS2PYI1_9BACL|nr:nucleoside hydrolase [Scopulibacillus daqui]MBM7644625.1 purine nucleosidase [Scopulibacillus daqui]